MKGEKHKRLSISTIERAGLLFAASRGHENMRNIPEFIWFLEKIEEEGLPAVRKEIENKLLLK